MNLLVIAGTVVGLLVFATVATFAVISMDLASYTATGSEALAPTGTQVGRSLVVYSPGLSGAARDAARKVAGELTARGYAVDLAGVRSAKTQEGAAYDVVVVGGPAYWGKLSASTGDYLKTLTGSARLGVYATTGTNQFQEVDFNSIAEQVASATGGQFQGRTTIKLILAGREAADYAELVSAVLQ